MSGAYHHGVVSTPPDCENCPFRYDRKVMPDGPVPARIAIVAESPGREELKQGRGLVGPTGQLVWQFAAACGLDRAECWVSNTMLCAPRDVRLTNGAMIKKDIAQAMAAKACRQRLVDELRVVNPVSVVALGNWTLWALSDIPNAKIYDYRGSRLDVDLAQLSYRIANGLVRSPIRQIRGKDQ